MGKFAELQKYCYTMQNKVTINERGVITIPAALRRALGLKANDELIVERRQEGILLRQNLALKRATWLPAFEDMIAGLEIAPSVLFQLPVEIAKKDAPLFCAAIRSQCTRHRRQARPPVWPQGAGGRNRLTAPPGGNPGELTARC